MELSTIIPSAITSAPRDMRSRSILKIAIKIKVANMVKINPVPMIIPMRMPMGMASTTSTMATASIRLTMKSLIAVLTKSDCQANLVISIPIGKCGMISFRRFSIFFPVCTTLPPTTLASWMAIAGLPLNRMRVLGGSRYPALTSAMSRMRISSWGAVKSLVRALWPGWMMSADSGVETASGMLRISNGVG